MVLALRPKMGGRATVGILAPLSERDNYGSAQSMLMWASHPLFLRRMDELSKPLTFHVKQWLRAAVLRFKAEDVSRETLAPPVKVLKAAVVQVSGPMTCSGSCNVSPQT